MRVLLVPIKEGAAGPSRCTLLSTCPVHICAGSASLPLPCLSQFDTRPLLAPVWLFKSAGDSLCHNLSETRYKAIKALLRVLKNYLSIYARSRLQKLTRKVQILTSTPLRFFSYRQQDPLPVPGIAAPRLVCGSWVLGLCPNKRRRVRGDNRRTACRVFIAINTLLATSQKQKKGTACPSLYNKHF